MKVSIGNLYFLILIPVIIFLIYYSIKKYKLISKNDLLILISRIVIFTLLILSFADITLSVKGKNISTVFLLDVSDSINDFKDQGQEFINAALEIMPKGNKAGVILFGDNITVEKVIDKKALTKELSDNTVKTATNIQQAIEGAISLFEEESAKRIVLITDGKENKGDILNSIPIIKAENIDLKVYKVSSENGNELYIDNVSVPDNISIGEEFKVNINIQSNYAGLAKLILFSGREKVSEESVQIQKGNNSFVFKDVQNSGGFKEYKVIIEAEEDSNKINNEYSAYTNVIDKPSILIINGVKGDSTALVEILQSGGANIKNITPGVSPSTLNELLEYKAIVLNNVHKDDLTEGFTNNIESYVKDYGGGVITFGGEDAYALGGYKDTVLERILPVDMDKKGENEVPPISINLIIDKSGSMESSGNSISKLTLAKEAAMKAIDNLREVDEVSVVAFDDKYSVVVPRQKVNNKEAIKEMISAIQTGGGTSIYPALKEGYNIQKESSSKIKHTILLTDGQDGLEYEKYLNLIELFNNENITLSTVAVGNDSNSKLLSNLSEIGNGRSYYTDIYTDIPRIFAQEVLLSVGTYIINEEFTPKIVSNHEILSGVETSNGMPSLLGYIGTSLKEDSIEILTSNRNEPILAVRQYGIGKTASFTTDVDGQWSKKYLLWEYGAKLIKNVVYYTLPSYDEDGYLSITQEGNEAIVEYHNDSTLEDTKVNGVYTNENGEVNEFSLVESEPGKYEASIPLKELGFYNFSIRESQGDNIISTYNGSFALQYSEEYKFNNNDTKIDYLVEEVNGNFINKAAEVFSGKLESNYKRINLTNLLLIMTFALFFFDIVYRRLSLDFTKYYMNKKIIKKKNKNTFIKEEFIVEDTITLRDNKNRNETTKKTKVKKEYNEKKQTRLDTNALLKKKNDRNGI